MNLRRREVAARALQNLRDRQGIEWPTLPQYEDAARKAARELGFRTEDGAVD
jgi:hypothetical protein